MQAASPASYDTHPAGQPAVVGYLLLLALATAFLFLLDELAGWLGWQLLQTPLLDGLALLCGLLLLPAAAWWALTSQMDWLDQSGALLGGITGGAFLACYTVFPPAGVVTLLIFALCVGYAMRSGQRQHLTAVSVMVLAFVAVSFLINDWRHGDEQLVRIDPQPPYIYYTTQQPDPATHTTYACQWPGLFCEPVETVPAVRPAGVAGAAGANLADF